MMINKGRKANKSATVEEKRRLTDPAWARKQRDSERLESKEAWANEMKERGQDVSKSYLFETADRAQSRIERFLDVEELVLNLTPMGLVSLLRKEAAGLDAVDEWGWTSLHKAAVYGKADHVVALLDAGANYKSRTVHDPTQMYKSIGL